MKESPRENRQQDDQDVARIRDHRGGTLLDEETVAKKPAADSGDESKGKQSHDIVAATHRGQRPRGSENERRAKVEQDRQLKRPLHRVTFLSICFHPAVGTKTLRSFHQRDLLDGHRATPSTPWK